MKAAKTALGEPPTLGAYTLTQQQTRSRDTVVSKLNHTAHKKNREQMLTLGGAHLGALQYRGKWLLPEGK